MLSAVYRKAVVLWLAVSLAAAYPASARGKESDKMNIDDSSGVRGTPAGIVKDLVLYPRTAVGFHEKPVPADTLKSILEAVTPYASLSHWKLITVQKKENRIRLLESMQAAYREQEKPRWAETMERWKHAPVILAFCMPEEDQDFGGVPADIMHPMALIELGMGVQSLILAARAHGIETHWIASALLIEDTVEAEIGVPDGYRLVFFGIAGYPNEEIEQPFTRLDEICIGDQ